MFRNKIFTVLLFGSLCASVTSTGAEVIFSDSFESDDMSTTNADGFKWGGLNKTSIVARDAACSTPSVDVVIFNGNTICTEVIPSVREWTGKDGKNSLRFRYAAGENWTEQRFEMNKGYPELWVSYWIRVPLNFSRGTTGSPTNNKWFIMFMGDHSLYDQSDVSHFITRDWPGSPSTSIDMDLQYYNADGPAGTSSRYPNFITPADAGRWMHIIYHMKASSGGGAKDGRVSWYRQWDGDAGYETIADLNNIEIAIGIKSTNLGYNGWGGGYIMGYANMPYAQDTEWLVDDFTISTSSLFPNLPKPPVGVTGTVSK